MDYAQILNASADVLISLHVVAVALIWGAIGRYITALHERQLNGLRPRVELAFGAILGLLAAGLYGHFYPNLDLDWDGWVKICAAGAAGGALGPRAIAVAERWASRKGGEK